MDLTEAALIVLWKMQKLHWVLKETYHFFRVMLTKIWLISKLQYSLIRTSENTKVYMCQKGAKCGEIAKVNFSKIAKTAHRASSTEAAYTVHSKAFHSISVDYVTTILAFVRAERRARGRAVSVMCEKLLLAIHHILSPFWPKQIFVFLDVLYKVNYS